MNEVRCWRCGASYSETIEAGYWLHDIDGEKLYFCDSDCLVGA
jgi:hypothetical protein